MINLNHIFRIAIWIEQKCFLLLTIGIMIACTSVAAMNNSKDKKSKPNIILIMADDMGSECLGSYGGLSYETPYLDNLASVGMRFTNCYSQPICTPSRVKIMTGRYNHENYIDFGLLDPNAKTFAHVLKDAGYKTMVAGKWQLNGAVEKVPGYDDLERPYQFGFDEYCLWQLTKTKKEGERFANPYIEQNGKALSTTIDDYGPDIVSNYILDFIERNKEQPFFVYYPMLLVHDPFVPTPDSPEWQDSTRRHEKNNRYFKDMVEYTDKIVGSINRKLEELGIADNTIVLFTGDNGTHKKLLTKTINGDYPGGKSTMRDNGTHVPMIAYWPEGGYNNGTECNSLISFADFLPTFADVVGAQPYEECDGRSFLNLLKGKNYKPAKHLYVHYHHKMKSPALKSNGHFVRTVEYKLYHDNRFFDMVNDKWETIPLDVDKLNSEVKKIYLRLKAEMDGMPKWDFKVAHTK